MLELLAIGDVVDHGDAERVVARRRQRHLRPRDDAVLADVALLERVCLARMRHGRAVDDVVGMGDGGEVHARQLLARVAEHALERRIRPRHHPVAADGDADAGGLEDHPEEMLGLLGAPPQLVRPLQQAGDADDDEEHGGGSEPGDHRVGRVVVRELVQADDHGEREQRDRHEHDRPPAGFHVARHARAADRGLAHRGVECRRPEDDVRRGVRRREHARCNGRRGEAAAEVREVGRHEQERTAAEEPDGACLRPAREEHPQENERERQIPDREDEADLRRVGHGPDEPEHRRRDRRADRDVDRRRARRRDGAED
ncbi:MAG TPA: hypothetical protein VGK79_00360 [Gaiellaceae bacterium]